MECNISGARPVGTDGRLTMYARMVSYLIDHPNSTRGQVLEGIGRVDVYDYKKHRGLYGHYFQRMLELGFITSKDSGRKVLYRPGMNIPKIYDSLFENSWCFVIRGNYAGNSGYLRECGTVYVSGNGIAQSPYKLSSHVNGAQHFWTHVDAKMLMGMVTLPAWRELIKDPEIVPVEMKIRRPYRFKRKEKDPEDDEDMTFFKNLKP